MLPLSLLKSSIDYPVLIELKNGETYNGKLVNIDLWMNVNLKEVIRTSRDGDEFWSVPEVYVRGNTIKYVRVPDNVLDAVAEEKQAREAARNRNRGTRQQGRSRAGGGGGGAGAGKGRGGKGRGGPGRQ